MSETVLSEAARNFLMRCSDLDSELPTAENIGRLRAQIREGYREAFESARRQYTSSLNSVSLGGVPCLEINPRSIDRERGDVVIFYLFGGGYIVGSPEEDLPISAFIANHLGVRTICPSYGLAPEYPFPAAFNDAISAYRALVKEATNRQILVVGESAGGHLALQTMLAACSESLRLPVGLALLSPWADISRSGDSISFNEGRDPTLSAATITVAAEMFAPDIDHLDQRVSPLFCEYPANFPATCISTGTRDLLMSSAIRLSRKLQKSGVDVHLMVWEQLWHVFEFYPDLPEAAESLNEISQFLASRLSPDWK